MILAREKVKQKAVNSVQKVGESEERTNEGGESQVRGESWLMDAVRRSDSLLKMFWAFFDGRFVDRKASPNLTVFF